MAQSSSVLRRIPRIPHQPRPSIRRTSFPCSTLHSHTQIISKIRAKSGTNQTFSQGTPISRSAHLGSLCFCSCVGAGRRLPRPGRESARLRLDEPALPRCHPNRSSPIFSCVRFLRVFCIPVAFTGARRAAERRNLSSVSQLPRLPQQPPSIFGPALVQAILHRHLSFSRF
jgi:hypothetical protein